MERLVLDACVVINLWAGEILDDLAGVCGVELAAATNVASEAMYVESEDPDAERERIDWDQLRDHGTVTTMTFTGEAELTIFLGFIPRLGDGEAASLTLAAERGFVLATDDALALRTAADHAPPIVTVTTPDIVSWWADEADKDEKQIAEAIQCIERRARFQPAPGHQLAAWWWQARETP